MTDDARQARIEQILAERLFRTERAIPARPPGPTPLSFIQHGLWLVWKMSDRPSEGCRPTAYRLKGVLDVGLVERVFDDIVAKHESLRTTYPMIDETPVQVVHQPTRVDIPLVDVSGDAAPEDRAVEVAAAHVRRGFDLEHKPPVDPLLIRIGEDDHLLAIAIHHIIFDGWSELVLANELRDGFARHAEDDPEPARPLAIQYADYASWQRSRFGEDALATSLDYWRNKLTPLPDELELPVRADESEDWSRETQTLLFDADLSQRLDQFARSMGATTFMTVAAAIQVLLARIAGQTQFLIGISSAGRGMPGTEQLIGCFINTLLLPARVPTEATFREIVERTRQEVLEALAHEHLPYANIVREFRPWSSGDLRPLFNVQLQMRDFPVDEAVDSRVEVEPQAPRGGTSEVLSIRARHHEGRTEVAFGFNLGQFPSSQVAVWVDDFQRIVAELVEQPDQPAWLVPMRSDRSGADEDPREESPMGRRRDGAPFSERNDTAAGGLAARVAEIWAGVLGVEVIPPRATFFELGGHSLLAIRLLNRIKDSLSVDLPLTTLFTHSSIEDFTARVAEELSVHGGSDDASIEAPSEAPAEVLDALLADVESMSDEEALALLTALEDGGEQ